MRTITATRASRDLVQAIRQVRDDREPVTITSGKDCAVVMLSLEDYESLEETAYLLRNPRNARRLMESIRELKKGRGRERQLFS